MKKLLIGAMVVGLLLPANYSFAAVKKPSPAASAKEGTATHETAESKTGTQEKTAPAKPLAKPKAKKTTKKKVAKPKVKSTKKPAAKK